MHVLFHCFLFFFFHDITKYVLLKVKNATHFGSSSTVLPILFHWLYTEYRYLIGSCLQTWSRLINRHRKANLSTQSPYLGCYARVLITERQCTIFFSAQLRHRYLTLPYTPYILVYGLKYAKNRANSSVKFWFYRSPVERKFTSIPWNRVLYS